MINFIFGEECLSLLSSNLLEANMIERHHHVENTPNILKLSIAAVSALNQ